MKIKNGSIVIGSIDGYEEVLSARVIAEPIESGLFRVIKNIVTGEIGQTLTSEEVYALNDRFQNG